jgi:hypothetical protein
MDDIRSTAFALTIFHAFLAALSTTLLIVLHDFSAETSFLIAANCALLFSLLLIARAGRLTDEQIIRGTFWRTVPVKHRPAGASGLRIARTILEETWLRFAKGAAVAAMILCSLAYASHAPESLSYAKAALTPGSAQAMTGAN